MCKKIVKKHQSYWVFILALLLSGTLHAQVSNYVGAYASLGEWTLMPSESQYGSSYGVAGTAGFLYELQAGPKYSPTRFLFDVGVGMMGGMTAYIQGFNQEAVLENQTDLQGETFDYVYSLKKRHDKYNDVAIQVPFLFGVQHRKFYMLAGVKVYSHVYTKTASTAKLTTIGRYTQFDDFTNMPEYQFFENRSVSGGVKTSLKLDLDLSLEVGGRIGVVNDGAVGFDVPKRKTEYRLAAFVDYGLFDVHYAGMAQALITPTGYNQGETAPVYNTTTMVDKLVMNDVMSTEGFAKSVNNFMVGLKFTVLFQLPEQGHCVLCRDSYRSLARPRGGGLQYEE